MWQQGRLPQKIYFFSVEFSQQNQKEGSFRLPYRKRTVGLLCILAVCVSRASIFEYIERRDLFNVSAHTFRNYREDWPSTVIVDLVGWMKTYDKLRERASSPDLLFPGHDRLMLENYPEVAKDITRLV